MKTKILQAHGKNFKNKNFTRAWDKISKMKILQAYGKNLKFVKTKILQAHSKNFKIGKNENFTNS